MKLENKYNYLFLFLVLLLLVDLSSSVYYYFNLPIDGDLARIVAPSNAYRAVLADPLGMDILKSQQAYAGAGRFSCHYFTHWWFTSMHGFVGVFVKDKVLQLYVTSTAFSLFLHLVFLVLAYIYAKGKSQFKIRSFIFIAFLATAFIQYNGYHECLGIIDRSINYCFFYALPLFVLLFYFYPFYKFYTANDFEKLPKFWHGILLLLGPLLAFSGPLIQPIVFILWLFYLLGTYVPNSIFGLRKSKWVTCYFIYIFIFCLYAFYITTYNIEADASVPIVKRYQLMLHGVLHILTLKPAWLFLFLAIAIQYYLAVRFKLIDKKTLSKLLLFILSFSLLYLFLLPWGGYRSYRPLIVRYDTFLPVTLCFVFLFVYLSHHIFWKIHGTLRIAFLGIIFSFWVIFSIADKYDGRATNDCQRAVLEEVLDSKLPVIKVEASCNVLTWTTAEFQYAEHMITINKSLKLWGFINDEQRVELIELK